MSYLLSNNDKTFIGNFGETSENQFSLLVTNCKEFFIENVSLEVLMVCKIENCETSSGIYEFILFRIV